MDKLYSVLIRYRDASGEENELNVTVNAVDRDEAIAEAIAWMMPRSKFAHLLARPEAQLYVDC
jgi:hypothetical protein